MGVRKASLIALAALIASACAGGNGAGSSNESSAPSEAVTDDFIRVDSFSADSAYNFIARQVAFGPRVPGSRPHALCADWLVDRLKAYGADTVFFIGTQTVTCDGSTVPVRNIIARFYPDSIPNGRYHPVLLASHYDTRPWADRDPDPEARKHSFDGANDGASGVAVILEIARNIGSSRPSVGVDILFTDVEDYGSPDPGMSEDTWCLGSQQFAMMMPYTVDDVPRFGILLDMVGGRDARFPREYFSTKIAPKATTKVWNTAARLGLGQRFPSSIGGAITDDHIPLSSAGIPTTDIIENANPSTGSFPTTWHTRNDNIDNIDPATLNDVGLVVLNVIYNEK